MCASRVGVCMRMNGDGSRDLEENFSDNEKFHEFHETYFSNPAEPVIIINDSNSKFE